MSACPYSLPCPAGCGRTIHGGHPLCAPCWESLPKPARSALSMVFHSRALADHQQLLDQLAAGVPVTEIRIGTAQRPDSPPVSPAAEQQLSFFDPA